MWIKAPRAERWYMSVRVSVSVSGHDHGARVCAGGGRGGVCVGVGVNRTRQGRSQHKIATDPPITMLGRPSVNWDSSPANMAPAQTRDDHETQGGRVGLGRVGLGRVGLGCSVSIQI